MIMHTSDFGKLTIIKIFALFNYLVKQVQQEWILSEDTILILGLLYPSFFWTK